MASQTKRNDLKTNTRTILLQVVELLINVSNLYGVDQCWRKCSSFQMYGSSTSTFVELALLNVYLVV
jgi:hypothetical protein